MLYFGRNCLVFDDLEALILAFIEVIIFLSA